MTGKPTPIGPAMRCVTCGYGLDQREDFEDGRHVGTTYFHGLERGCTDVKPIPISPDYLDQISVCDFCSAIPAPWTFPAQDFMTMGAYNPGESLEAFSSGAWGACDACHALIDDDNYPALGIRAIEALGIAGRARIDQDTREHIAGLHSAFRANRTGPPTRAW